MLSEQVEGVAVRAIATRTISAIVVNWGRYGRDSLLKLFELRPFGLIHPRLTANTANAKVLLVIVIVIEDLHPCPLLRRLRWG